MLHITVDRWHRKRGHKPGEGVFSPRDGEVGVRISDDSESDLGRYIAVLAKACPAELERHVGKTFELTRTEGGQLRAMAEASQITLNKWVEVTAKIIELNNGISALEMTEPGQGLPADGSRREVGDAVVFLLGEKRKLLGDLKLVTKPISLFLSTFPGKRVKG